MLWQLQAHVLNTGRAQRSRFRIARCYLLMQVGVGIQMTAAGVHIQGLLAETAPIQGM